MGLGASAATIRAMPDTAADPAHTVQPPLSTVSYGADPAQVYDIRLPPSGRPEATVVVVHGGFWRERHDRSNAAPMAQALAEHGFAVALLEYRRAGMPGGGWPGTCDDVGDALDAVSADPSLPAPLVAVGHSAGGHLVAWLASRGQSAAAGLVGAVSLGGCVDLSLTARMELGDGAARGFMGGGPDEVPERYAAADPVLLVPPVVPVHLVHGTADDVVPVQVSQSYVRAAEETGTPSTQVWLTALPGVDHMSVIDPGHPAFAAVLDAVRGLAGGIAGTPTVAAGGADAAP